MFSKNTSTTYKYFFMFVFFSLFLWQSFTIKPEASEIITDPLISMTVCANFGSSSTTRISIFFTVILLLPTLALTLILHL